MVRFYSILLVLFAVRLLTGCSPLTTFQSPVVVENRTAFGIGTASVIVDKNKGVSAPVDVNIWCRVPIFPHSDFGMRIAPFEGTTIDLKYNFLRSPILVSGDIAVSYSIDELPLYYPMLLFGTEHFYGGIKYAQFPFGYQRRSTGFMLGASFGNRTKFMPEIDYWDNLDGGFAIGIGILFTFSDDTENK